MNRTPGFHIRLLACTSLSFVICAITAQVSAAELADGFSDALASAERPAEDKERDAARRPREVLTFLEIGSGMTVLDTLASSGWYTEVLSAAVGPSGKVIAQNTARGRQRAGDAIIARAERLGNVEVLFADFDAMQLENDVDAALTALNLHDMLNRSDEAAQEYLGAVYRALKPGGVFGVIDHEGISSLDNRALHRIEVAIAIAALEQAGFEIDAISETLHNELDDHTLNIRDEKLERNTDRFLIKALKPD